MHQSNALSDVNLTVNAMIQQFFNEVLNGKLYHCTLEKLTAILVKLLPLSFPH